MRVSLNSRRWLSCQPASHTIEEGRLDDARHRVVGTLGWSRDLCFTATAVVIDWCFAFATCFAFDLARSFDDGFLGHFATAISFDLDGLSRKCLDLNRLARYGVHDWAALAAVNLLHTTASVARVAAANGAVAVQRDWVGRVGWDS